MENLRELLEKYIEDGGYYLAAVWGDMFYTINYNHTPEPEKFFLTIDDKVVYFNDLEEIADEIDHIAEDFEVYNLEDELVLSDEIIKKSFLDNSFTVTSAWVEENDEEVYDHLHDMMEDFVNDEEDDMTEEDLEEFENGDWLVLYSFVDAGVEFELLEFHVTSGRDLQSIANQDSWIQEHLYYDQFQQTYPVNTYLEQIEQGEN